MPPQWRFIGKSNENLPPYPELPPSLWDWLQTRGITTHQQVNELREASLRYLKSPFLIKGVEKSALRILEAYKKNQKICIYGDFDMDGTPAVAILYKGFEDLGFQNLFYYQPSRLS